MKRTGKKTALTAAVCVLCVLLIAAGAGKIWLDFRRGNPNQKLYGREILLSSEMSPQERQIDFAELCVFLEKNAPVVNSFEELYGISYESIKEYYGKLAASTETYCGYYACLAGFMNNIPSAHAAVGFPAARLADDNMELWLSENQSFGEVQAYWLETLHYECAKYYENEPEKIVFSYYSGDYIGASLSEDDNYGADRAVLLSVNGVPADDFIRIFSSTYKMKYDHAAGIPFRDSIIFNDGFGEPCEIEYRTAEGELKTAQLYCGAEAEICLNSMEYFKMLDGVGQRENSGGTSPREPLNVLLDKENGIATVFIDSFDSDTVTGKVIANTVKTVSEDFDNIIIDIRNNNGGYIEYAYDVLSALSPKDFEVSDTVFCTEDSFKRNGDIFAFRRGEDGMYSRTERTSVNGEAAEGKKLYLLVSDKTASAADLLASEFKRNGLGTVVGVNNTGGEKNGTVRLSFCTGSGIYFYYTEYASLNPDGTDNGVYGTAPDILLKADPESYFIRECLREQGEDIYSLENRLEWDGVLRQTYELIKEQN